MRYAAIGDSFTEGLGDQRADGSPRGWADRLAAGLATSLGEPIWYANFAVRGRLLDLIAAEQVDPALALDPAPSAPPRPPGTGRTLPSDVRFYLRHVGPWLGRRALRRSSGDGRVPKHPQWVEVPPTP
ncbi:MAG: hypothetical protein LBS27_01225 [Bifidobacteriaceae bacterium]|jgi:hypothetical protein|nr:hypothetical protein [Bifidobacteriaceae bacterium]